MHSVQGFLNALGNSEIPAYQLNFRRHMSTFRVARQRADLPARTCQLRKDLPADVAGASND